MLISSVFPEIKREKSKEADLADVESDESPAPFLLQEAYRKLKEELLRSLKKMKKDIDLFRKYDILTAVSNS